LITFRVLDFLAEDRRFIMNNLLVCFDDEGSNATLGRECSGGHVYAPSMTCAQAKGQNVAKEIRVMSYFN